MGTDIHLYVERFVDGAWQIVAPPEKPKNAKDQWWECFYSRSCRGLYDRHTDDTINCPHTLQTASSGSSAIICGKCAGSGRDMKWYRNRNYWVFAVLADVRNREGLKPIANPRGCPDDASLAVRHGNSWDHTPSWLLVSELLAYDWARRTEHTGLLSMAEYKKWRKKKKRERPNDFCLGVHGGNVLTEVEADKRLASGKKCSNDEYVHVSWEEAASSSCDDFVEFIHKWLVPVGPPDQVRIVFGFDS